MLQAGARNANLPVFYTDLRKIAYTDLRKIAYTDLRKIAFC